MNTIDLDSLVLKVGAHDDWEHGACLLEAASYVAGEAWSDAPQCVCEVLARMCALGEAERGGRAA